MVRTNRQPTLAELRERRDQILQIATAHGAANVRIFGSVARGEADSASDVDVLIDVVAEAPGFRYFGLLEDLRRALEADLGFKVDILDAAALADVYATSHADVRERVLKDAVPL
jgi:predicted nucleotidyltransferase